MNINIETFEKVKNNLKDQKNVGATKTDLYTHMTEIFNRVMLHHPYDAYDKFEEISHLVKRTHLKIKDPKYDHQVNKIKDEKKNPQVEQMINQSKNLIRERIDLANKADKLLLSTQNPVEMPNVSEEVGMLEWAGVGLGGDQAAFIITKSLKKLATLSGAKSLRLWGKIFGTQKDYVVAEGVLDFNEEANSSPTVEARGKGTNTRVYWVTDNILDDWVQLPEATPEYIQAARRIKHLMTGNLNAAVNSCPPFPGKERHYLRAQIARISHATTLIPKGLFEIDEETQEMKFAEEFALPAGAELLNKENWVHLNPIVLKAGRITHLPPNVPEEEQEAEMEKLNGEDPSCDRFRDIAQDAPIEGLETSWLLKNVGDNQPYNKTSGEGTQSYNATVIKSLRWPGAVTVVQNGTFCNFYSGNGMKKGDVCLNPTEPPEIMDDPEDQVEQPEPTPLHAPEEPLEPDTEKPEGEGAGEEEA